VNDPPGYPLAELARFVSGGTPSKRKPEFYKGTVPWITGADMSLDGSYAARSYIADLAIRKSTAPLVRRNTVLLVTRTTVGKVALTIGDVSFSQDITGICPDVSRLDPCYLKHFLRARKSYFEKYARGATIKGVTRDVVGNVQVPLPPLNRQRKVAEILDAANELRRMRDQFTSRLLRLYQAVFAGMFGDPCIGDVAWPRVCIGDIGQVITGNTPTKEVPSSPGDVLGWAKSDNLTGQATYVTRPIERVSRTATRSPRVVGAGSILVTCIAGSRDSIGKSAIADREISFNQQINAVVPEKMESEFLYVQLQMLKRRIQDASTGGMKGIVNKTRFSEIEIIAPPLDLQKEYVRRFHAIEGLKRADNQQRALFDELFGSLQHRAFSGGL
jgi:type I restriction enzyme, S subunit